MSSWRVIFTPEAEKQFQKLDRTTQQHIRNFLRKRISAATDPHDYGKPLVGELTGLWRYRVGKYRLICDIQEEKLTVLVITLGKRDKVYRS